MSICLKIYLACGFLWIIVSGGFERQLMLTLMLTTVIFFRFFYSLLLCAPSKILDYFCSLLPILPQSLTLTSNLCNPSSESLSRNEIIFYNRTYASHQRQQSHLENRGCSALIDVRILQNQGKSLSLDKPTASQPF